MAFKKILVPLDGSILAEHAIGTAADLAAGGATVMLVRAAEAHGLPGVDPTDMQVDVVREAAEHRDEVADGVESLGHTATDATGRRGRIGKLRMGRLERGEFAHERVVFLIGDFRRVVDEVAFFVIAQQAAEFSGTGGVGHGGRIEDLAIGPLRID